MLDGVLSRVLSYRLFSPAGYPLVVSPASSGRGCHSYIKEGWNRTITKTKLSRFSRITPLLSLPAIPRDCYLFRLNESHIKNNAKEFADSMNALISRVNQLKNVLQRAWTRFGLSSTASWRITSVISRIVSG